MADARDVMAKVLFTTGHRASVRVVVPGEAPGPELRPEDAWNLGRALVEAALKAKPIQDFVASIPVLVREDGGDRG